MERRLRRTGTLASLLSLRIVATLLTQSEMVAFLWLAPISMVAFVAGSDLNVFENPKCNQIGKMHGAFE
jgi:hypothetical protein